MIILKLAFRNLAGAGMRTILNAVVLSLVLVVIVTAQALLRGMNEQTARAMIASEYGGGQVWHPGYDPYDPLTLDRAHGPVPAGVRDMISAGAATPILIVPGSIYPDGRLRSVLIKGIDPDQNIVDLPARFLKRDGDAIPAMIGTRMAENTGFSLGDRFVLQWRDRNGTFDAREALVVQVIRTSVQSVDKGQVWIPLERLRRMAMMPNEATLVTLAPAAGPPPGTLSPAVADAGDKDSWIYREQSYLLHDIRVLVRSKMIGSMFIYAILLFLALLAVFDTQVFAIFKRQREIGTLVALGMTRSDVLRLFTLEGGLAGLFAAILGTAYGTPLLSWFARTGWRLPETTDSYGFAIGDVLYPVFSADVVLGTGIIVLLLTVFVSFIPARRIARIEPTQALRGKAF